MEVEHVSTSDLAGMAAPYNPRKISDHDLAALQRSLRFFGTVEPIVVNRRSGHIVGGHQRVKAAEAEGIETLPVVYVDLDDPSEKQLNLALNRISGEFDMEKLAELLKDLEAQGADLDLTGFTTVEIDELLRGGVDEPAEGLTDPDSIPEPPDDPKTQPGDLIVLGRHRLLCGDSANQLSVELLLGDERIHLVNMDPPYNVNVEPRQQQRDRGRGEGEDASPGIRSGAAQAEGHPDGEDACQGPSAPERLPAAGGVRATAAGVVQERGGGARTGPRLLHLGRIRKPRQLPTGAEGRRPLLLAGDHLGQGMARPHPQGLHGQP